MIQVIFDTGILTFPYSFKANGVLFAILLLLVSASISWFTGMLLVCAAEHTKQYTFQAIGQALFGRKTMFLCTVLLMTSLLANAISYLVFMRVTIP